MSVPSRGDGPVAVTGPSCFWRGASVRAGVCAVLLAVAWVGIWNGPPVWAGEYRDPEGRFTIAVTDGFVEVPRPVLETRLAALRQSGTKMPSYQAAFDRGVEPRLAYPYALLEVVPVQGAVWTTADLETLLGELSTGQAAPDAAAAFDRLGLGNLLRDPRITFIRWEPQRQAGVYRLRTQVQGAEIHGEGRIAFYRNGYIALWVYYQAGTPFAEAAKRFTAALEVAPEHRVPNPRLGVRRWILAAAGAGGLLILIVLAVWLRRERRRAKQDA